MSGGPLWQAAAWLLVVCALLVAVPSSSVTPGPAPHPSGVAAPAGDVPGWRQVFSEDFNADVALGAWPGPYASRWDQYDDGPDTSGVGAWATSTSVSVSGGAATYHLRTVDGVPRGVALLPRTAPQTYGRYTVRFRVDPGLEGWASAWLLWPDDGVWPAHGEVDWPEGELDGPMSANHHHADPAGGLDTFDSGVPFSSGWHTATTEWTEGLVVFVLDGVEVGRSTTQVPTTPMHWVLQTETAYGARPPAGSTGTIEIDWAVVYAQG